MTSTQETVATRLPVSAGSPMEAAASKANRPPASQRTLASPTRRLAIQAVASTAKTSVCSATPTAPATTSASIHPLS